MPKKKSPTSTKSMAIFAGVAAVFVTLIAWGAFDDLLRVALAGGLTFVIVFAGLAALNKFSKEDEDVEPGKPRLK
jgi:multidrug transporter EmrE-like cation transporter